MDAEMRVLLQNILDAIKENTAEVAKLCTLVQESNAMAEMKTAEAQKRLDGLTETFPMLSAIFGGMNNGQ